MVVSWDALERSIDVQISRLHRLIEPDPSKPRYIQTVWGVGYVFVPDGNKLIRLPRAGLPDVADERSLDPPEGFARTLWLVLVVVLFSRH